MTRAVFAPILGPEFDPFLSAPIATDRNGTLVSVLSAFARTEVDPWKEAAYLARMSRETATTRLAAFIVAMPDSASADTPAITVARNLVDLLPKTMEFASPFPVTLPAGAPSNSLRFSLMLGAIALLVAIALTLWSFSVWQGHPGEDSAAPTEQTSPRPPTSAP